MRLQQRCAQLGEHLPRQRIAPVRPVEGDARDALSHLEGEVFIGLQPDLASQLWMSLLVAGLFAAAFWLLRTGKRA